MDHCPCSCAEELPPLLRGISLGDRTDCLMEDMKELVLWELGDHLSEEPDGTGMDHKVLTIDLFEEILCDFPGQVGVLNEVDLA